MYSLSRQLIGNTVFCPDLLNGPAFKELTESRMNFLSVVTVPSSVCMSEHCILTRSLNVRVTSLTGKSAILFCSCKFYYLLINYLFSSLTNDILRVVLL